MSLPLNQYTQYVPLDNNELPIKLGELASIFTLYLKTVGIDQNDVIANTDNILEIIERVEKRRVYFKIFHKIDMSERNEASLYCFWILKLSPFTNLKTPNHRINIAFAAFLFLRTVTYLCVQASHKVIISEDYLKDLLYAFAVRDLSKESIMALAETLLI